MMWVAAIVRNGASLLMVRQQGPDDPAAYWYIPGGQVEEGESLVDALARELREETGLTLTGEPRIAYQAATGTAFEVTAWTGEIRCDDPSGLVLEVGFIPSGEAIERLRRVPHELMRSPLLRYLVRPGLSRSNDRQDAGPQ